MENLQDPSLCETIAGLLRVSDAGPAGWLTVEVTESTMMANPARARMILCQLHEMGVRIAIDDFGTGYSSLAYLKDLPADEVKIDCAFIKDMLTDRRAACITRTVIDLGHNLGLRVVAEGVEDQETCALLAAWGCDVGQGYLFSRPLPPGDFLDWVRQSRPEPSPGPQRGRSSHRCSPPPFPRAVFQGPLHDHEP